MSEDNPKGIARTQRVSPSALDSWVDGGRLTCISGAAEGTSCEVSEKPILIGRDDGCDLALSDNRVSATHLELSPTEEGVVARDLDTTNGTWIGNVRVHEVVLADGTELTVGGSVLRFTYSDSPARVQRAALERYHGLVGRSPRMRALYALLDRLAKTSLSVLIQGETGTGKELIARALHEASDRASGPMIVVDCGSVPATLIESTLFGYEKGAFSGADTRKIGLVEAADGGTLLLDEIGELPLEMQTRFLRVLETNRIRRVGATQEIDVDVRFVSATHRDLPAMVAAGGFRSDLFFRLATARVAVPPLRERPGDIQLLAEALLEDISTPPPTLSPDAIAELERRDYPGNVRELRNLLSLAVVFAEHDVIRADHLTPDFTGKPRAIDAADPDSDPLDENVELPLYRDGKEAAIAGFDRRYFDRLMREAGGNLTHAAARAGIERHHLRALLKKRGLR